MTPVVDKISVNQTFPNITATSESNKKVLNAQNTKHESDSVEINRNKKRKNGKIIGGVIAIGGLLGTAATLAIMIGRNPACAAKVLKGNSNIVNKAYEEGSKIADEILSKTGKFCTTEENIMSLFKDMNKGNRLIECPKDILPNDGIFYHGTRKADKIYKSGFTPFVSNQLNLYGRELGAGVYVAPNPRIAAAFSGLTGDIIPVKLTKDAKIALITEDIHAQFFKKTMELITERYPADEFNKLSREVRHATIECTFRNLFKHAGYDAAYIPKGVKGGGLLNFILPDINKIIGVEQKQLVIFSPEKLEIVPRTFNQRVHDLKDKFDAFISAFKFGVQHPFGF